MQEEVIVAEFMGYKVIKGNSNHTVYIDAVFENDLRYHESWDALIPVCKKISDLHWSDAAEAGGSDEILEQLLTEIIDALSLFEIEKVFNSVVKYIEQHNFGRICQHENLTWSDDAGCDICDDCNVRMV